MGVRVVLSWGPLPFFFLFLPVKGLLGQARPNHPFFLTESDSDPVGHGSSLSQILAVGGKSFASGLFILYMTFIHW